MSENSELNSLAFLLRHTRIDPLEDECKSVNMKPTQDRLLLRWIPPQRTGAIHLPSSVLDYHNTDSVKTFKVIEAGPGRYTRKGAFVPNEVNPGDKVLIDCRTGNRPEEVERGLFLVRNQETVIAVIPEVEIPTVEA